MTKDSLPFQCVTLVNLNISNQTQTMDNKMSILELEELCRKNNWSMETDNEGQIIIFTGVQEEGAE